jgi:outer membrane scaffolding protein for murein synthesis (MipA/OmpV family)
MRVDFARLLFWMAMAGVGFAPLARAQEVDGRTSEFAVTDKWSVTLGAGVAAQPRYEGAKRLHLTPVPLVALGYDNRVFLGAGGVSINLADPGPWRFGPTVGIRGGRQESDDSQLRGLGDLQTALTGGVFAEYRWQNLTFAAQINQAMTHSKYGATARLGVQYRFALVPGRLTGSIGPSISFGDRQYEQTLFGITDEQARRSAYARYTPGAGLKEFGLSGELTWRLTDHIFLRNFAALRYLAGSAGDSPIVRRKLQPVVGTGIAYRF